LNRISLVSVKFDNKKVSIMADLTSAYEPEVGVKKFLRNFEFTAPNNFTIRDEVETDKPQIITSYLHADSTIRKISDRIFEFESGRGTSLSAEITEPKTIETKIEKNILTAPGRPGSVDKGEQEERGVRLAISTEEKLSKAVFLTKLKIQNK
jgi:hypothetical protein